MLSKPQIRAILDKMQVFEDGHFVLAGRHTAQIAYGLRVLQQPEYATSLAVTLGASFRSVKPQAVMAGPGIGALLGLELARVFHARLLLAIPGTNGHWGLLPGQALEAGERVLLCESQVFDPAAFDGMIGLVSALDAQIIGAGTLLDRTVGDWPYTWPLESLVRPDAPLVDIADCKQCAAGLPASDPIGALLA